MDRPPISLKRILSHLGVTVEVTDQSMKAEAELHAEDTGYRVLINRRALEERWQRARFTIAHECGHILIFNYLRDPELIHTLDQTAQAHAELERLCDIAAVELLMPKAMLRAAVRDNGVTPRGLKVLLESFAVSREALVKNISEVLPGTSLFTWQRYARTPREERTFRVVASPRYHPSNARPWLPEGSTARHVSPQIIQRAARERTHILEENLEISLDRPNGLRTRAWHGRGLVTFFPPVARGKQLNLEANSVTDAPVSDNYDDTPILNTLYLFAGDRRTTSPQQFLGMEHRR